MKTTSVLFWLVFLTGVAAQAAPAQLQCSYTYQRNSQNAQKVQAETALLPDQATNLDDPSAGNLRARISTAAELDGHQLVLNAMLSPKDSLNLALMDQSVEGGASMAGVSDVHAGQVVHAQYNFSTERGVITLVMMKCKVTD